LLASRIQLSLGVILSHKLRGSKRDIRSTTKSSHVSIKYYVQHI